MYTAFLQDEISLIERRLSLTLGTKLLRTNFIDFELEPSVRLAWTPTENQTIWAAFTHSVRTPSRAEVDFLLSGYITTTPAGVPYFARFNANRDFAPEQLNGYELGYRRLLRHNVFLDLSTFYNRYHDLFSEDITGATYLENSPAPAHFLLPAQFRNDLLGATTGVEIAPEITARIAFWRLRGSYSFLHIDLKKAPNTPEIGSAPQIEGGSPQHQGQVESSWELSRKLQLDLTYRYVGALPSHPIPAYSTGDARLAWKVTPQLEVAFVGRNLLQPWHAEYLGDPGLAVGIKRSGYIRVTWSR